MYCQDRRTTKNIGGAELTIDGVDTTPILFIHSYRKTRRRGRSIYQCPIGNATIPPDVKAKNSIKGTNIIPETNKWKKGEGEKFLKY